MAAFQVMIGLHQIYIFQCHCNSVVVMFKRDQMRDLKFKNPIKKLQDEEGLKKRVSMQMLVL